MPTFLRSLRWRLAQFLEFRWWRTYLRSKPPATYLADKTAYWDRLLTELEWDVVPGARVLDAGCGPAGVFIYLRGRQSVTALDPLLQQYEELPIFKRSDYPEIDFIAEPLEEYVSEKPYAAIYCFNAINHVHDWAASLDALTAAAGRGTRLLLTSDVHRHRWLQPVFRLLPGDALHPQQHGAEAYRTALSDRGWKLERERVLRRETIFEYRAWVATFVGCPAGKY